MRQKLWVIWALLLVIVTASANAEQFASGAATSTVSVTSSSACTEVVSKIRAGLTVQLDPAATGRVWLIRSESCPAVKKGILLSVDTADKFDAGWVTSWKEE